MAERIRKVRVPSKKVQEQVVEDQPASSAQHDAEVAAIDELLDEIDGVLEENAEEFVKGYVQKGVSDLLTAA